MLKSSPPGTRPAAMRTMPIRKTVALTRNIGSIGKRQLCELAEKQILRTSVHDSAVFRLRITYAGIISKKAWRLKRISNKAHLGLPPRGWNLEHTLLEAILLIDFLPFKAGSEQRPHQKTQSIQRETLDSELLVPNVGLSKYSKKELKKEKRLVFFRTYVGGSDGTR